MSRVVLCCVLVLCLSGALADRATTDADIDNFINAAFKSENSIADAIRMHRSYQRILETFSFDFFDALIPHFNVSHALNAPVCLLEQALGLTPAIEHPNPKFCNENLGEMKLGMEMNILALSISLKTPLEVCGFIQVLKNAVQTLGDIAQHKAGDENCLSKEHLVHLAGQLRDMLVPVVAAHAPAPIGKAINKLGKVFTEVDAETREWEIPSHLGIDYHPEPSYHFTDAGVHEAFLLEVSSTNFASAIVKAVNGLLTYVQGMMNRVGEAYGTCKKWNVKLGMQSKLNLPPLVHLHIKDFNSVCALMLALPEIVKDLAAKADEGIHDFISSVGDVAKEVGEGIKKGAEAVAHGAENLGHEIAHGVEKVGHEIGHLFGHHHFRAHLSDIPITHRVLNYGAEGMLSQEPVFVEYATMFLAGPHANKLRVLTNFLETETNMHAGLRSHLMVHQRALATALAETKGIVSILMDAVQPILRLPSKVMNLFHGNGDQCTLLIPNPTNFSQHALEQFKLGLSLDLELKLPIQLPGLHWAVEDGFGLCKMISGLQHFLESLENGSFEKEIMSDLHTLYDGVKDAAKEVGHKVGEAFAAAKHKLFGFKQHHHRHRQRYQVMSPRAEDQQELQAATESRYLMPEVVFLQENMRLQNRHQFGLSDIWKKIIHLIEEPVTYVAKIFSLINGGVKDCEKIVDLIDKETAKVGLTGIGERMNFELDAELQLPPSPLQKIFAVTIKDTKTICIMANAVRRIKSNKEIFTF